jgi:hypothetical protein
MQRHFSNRGEALAEVTAARMVARRRGVGKNAFIAQSQRGGPRAEWFSHGLQTSRIKKTNLKPHVKEPATLPM